MKRESLRHIIKGTILFILLMILLPWNPLCNNPQPLNDNDNEMFGWIKRLKQKQKERLSFSDYNIIFDNQIVDGVEIDLLTIGNLAVPTGKIIICDPLVFFDCEPLTKTVKPGTYPIKIYVAKGTDMGNRNAIAKLELSDRKAVKWVLALRADEDLKELTDEYDIYGFPVDAGLGGFLDEASGIEYLKFLSEFTKENPEGNIYDDFFAAEFKKNAKDQNNPNDIGDWINFQLPDSDLNITMFSSGYGDGVYPAYWGIDEDGDIVSLVIDFLVVGIPKGK